MRELTFSEHRTILSLFALPTASEHARMRWAELPSSTYNVVRRRVYEAGWVRDHLIPDPALFGLLPVEISLARPATSDRVAWVASQSGDPSCVLLIEGIHTVLQVRFAGATRKGGGAGSPGTGGVVLTLREEQGSAPVFFDFAGLWARFGKEPPAPAYPRGLDLAPRVADRRSLAAARQALSEMGGPKGSSGTEPGWVNLLRLPRSQRRAVEREVLHLRTVPDLAKVPPYEGRRLGEVVLVTGTLKSGHELPYLLNDLTGDCRVYPFLLAAAQGKVLMAGVGQTSSKLPGRVPVTSARRSVTSTLMEHLDHVDFWIEPVESWVPRVDHRYEPLASTSPPGSDGA